MKICLSRLLEIVLGAKKVPSTTTRRHFTGGRRAVDTIEGMTTRVVKRGKN